MIVSVGGGLSRSFYLNTDVAFRVFYLPVEHTILGAEATATTGMNTKRTKFVR